MSYSSLLVRQFRSYAQRELRLSSGVTVIVGPNGSGKTNLLEALYVVSQGTSFRTADKDLVRHGQSGFKLEAQYGDDERVVRYQLGQLPHKQFLLNGAIRQRLSYQQKIPVVLFEPDDLRLIGGSPQRRREYLDNLCARLWPEAAACRGRYERTLLQRNNVLRQAVNSPTPLLDDQLFVWDIKLAEYAAALVELRYRVLDAWNKYLSETYGHIASSPSKVAVIYHSSVPLQNYKSNLLHLLNNHRQQDIVRGFTSCGPHRDDFELHLNDMPAASSASRGEVRTLVLALKKTELQLFEQEHHIAPLLLLDDVFSELDVQRRQSLVSLMQHYQTVITTTDADNIMEYLQTILSVELVHIVDKTSK